MLGFYSLQVNFLLTSFTQVENLRYAIVQIKASSLLARSYEFICYILMSNLRDTNEYFARGIILSCYRLPKQNERQLACPILLLQVTNEFEKLKDI